MPTLPHARLPHRPRVDARTSAIDTKGGQGVCSLLDVGAIDFSDGSEKGSERPPEGAHQVLADLLVGGHVRRPGLGTSRQTR